MSMTYQFMTEAQVWLLVSLLCPPYLVSAPTFRAARAVKAPPVCPVPGAWRAECKRPAPPSSIVMASWRMAGAYITQYLGLAPHLSTDNKHYHNMKCMVRIS